MKTTTYYRYPVVLTIAGSDSSGGAGIQADIKTFSALGVYGTSAITAVTAQNTKGVHAVYPLPPETLRSQLEALWDDIRIDAVKIGMLHNEAFVEVVAEILDTYRPPHIILDPVLLSSGGIPLLSPAAVEQMKEQLFPRITLLTPNTDEAGYLTGITIRGEEERQEAAASLLAKGCPAVLIKGGHMASLEKTDILFQPGSSPMRFSSETVSTVNTHGTGCTLSSAIAAYSALGYSLPDAIRQAKNYMAHTLREGADILFGHGYGPVNHLFAPSPLKKIPVER